MKKKFQYSDILLVMMPIVMLIISMTIDYLEPITAKYYSRIFKMDLLMWLWSLGRVVFVLVIFAGVLYFVNNKHRTKFHSIVWLGLGFLAMFVSTPWGHAINWVNIQMRFFQFFPRNLFFLAGAFLLVTGIYGLIRPYENQQKNE
ncbi:MAG: hypothetical protein CVU43_22105 [Chloroflexi bacterium HGW-Chloroflexi-5]|nr:MAG: hypothetical protein CVU43_22105 [Chloroflexi bacterium HGW-Chloroflexi-5]